MKVRLNLSADTLAILEDLESEDGMEPAKRVHLWLRQLLFTPGNALSASWCAEVSAAKQRGTFRYGSREWTWDDLLERAGAFAPKDPQPETGLEVVLGQRVGDLLPRVIALNDLRATPGERSERVWHDLEGFIVAHTTGEAAKAEGVRAAREAEDEEKALYPVKPKPAAKPA